MIVYFLLHTQYEYPINEEMRITRKNEDTDIQIYKDADFETAISEAGFGKFNIFLLLLAIPCFFASNFESTVISYVLPVAHCDLNMDLKQRGLLSGISYLGMVISAFLWGFLADTLGRKKIVVFCYTLNACLIILSGLSQTFEMLITLKFITGFIINGPFVTLTSLLSEFHSSKYRAQVILWIGMIYGIANVIATLLAWLIIPLDWNLQSKNENFNLHSWNFFIMISALPSIISGIGLIFVPESPKYLMTAGRNDQALKVFQWVYSLNTGKTLSEYPVLSLIDEERKRAQYKSPIQALKAGFKQIKPLFFQPHLINFLLLCVMQTGLIGSMNGLRLWLPQIFTILSDYQTKFPEDTDADLCKMLESVSPDKYVNSTEDIPGCVMSATDSSMYINVLIVSSMTIVAFLIIEVTINRVGKKPTLIVLGCVSGVSGFCIYFAQNTQTMTALSSINIAFVTICTDTTMAIIVDVFPTSLRTVAISIILTVGRLGGLVGNILLPILLLMGCLPPFLTLGCTVLFCSLLTFFLPNTDNKALE